MAKFIKIKNIIFNINEIKKIHHGYFHNIAETYWYVRVICDDNSSSIYKFADEQEAIDFLDKINVKLGAMTA